MSVDNIFPITLILATLCCTLVTGFLFTQVRCYRQRYSPESAG